MNDAELKPLDPAVLLEAFPVASRSIYVNHAAMSPWPKATRDAVVAFAELNFQEGPLAYAQWMKEEEQLRERVARLLNAESSADIALLANTSTGINLVSNGIEWKPGDNIVTPGGEFASNQLPWDALSERGVELRCVDIRAAEDPEEALLSRIDSRSRVLTVSSVQWNDGFRLDLGRLGKACRQAGVLFFVDAIQQFGALPIDVRGDCIDCLSAGSHKWQMGPEGIGVFYCREEIRQQLRFSQYGWRMLEDPFSFEREDRKPWDSGRRFEPGSPNTMGQVALNASLGVLESFGMEAIGARILSNTRELIAAINEIPGLELVNNVENGRLSGIVSVAPVTVGVRKLYQGLRKGGITCAVRDGNLRISPHFYLLPDQMQELLGVLHDSTN